MKPQVSIPTSKRVNSRTVDALQAAFDRETPGFRRVTVTRERMHSVIVSPDCPERLPFAQWFAAGWLAAR